MITFYGLFAKKKLQIPKEKKEAEAIPASLSYISNVSSLQLIQVIFWYSNYSSNTPHHELTFVFINILFSTSSTMASLPLNVLLY